MATQSHRRTIWSDLLRNMSNDRPKRSQGSPGHILYPRHFLVLAAFSASVAAITRLHLSTDLSASFALYGALHATALVVALRARRSIWRMCLFIAMAAALSAITLRAGIFAGQLSGALARNFAPYAVLGLSAAAGAVAYGILIRLFGIYELSLNSLTVVAIGCMLATWTALFTLAHIHSLGTEWFAIFWGHAFSGGLWYFDRRPHF